MSRQALISALCAGLILTCVSFNTITMGQGSWKAPSWTDTLKNPYQVRWGASAISPSKLLETRDLYNTFCATCHGKAGSGDGTLGAGLEIRPADFHSNAVKEQKDGAIFWKLSEGRGNMPSYKAALSEEKRWLLTAYIRQLSGTANGVPGVLKFENSSLANFIVKPGMSSAYFPVPKKVRNMVRSKLEDFMVDTVVSGLKKAWSMAFLPDGSMLIAERSGKLLRVKNGKIDGKPVSGNLPNELRDIKLHPQFKENGLVYFSYYIESAKPGGSYTVLMRARLAADKLVDEQKLYQAGPFTSIAFYYGSKIAFDHAGHLFFTVGISGDRKNAQNLSNHAGKIMRLNDDGSIPADNPFFNTPGALPEIYSYGHRMQQGLLYDVRSARLLSTEFGELGGDELNNIKRGANYGWPEVTFSREYTGEAISQDSLRKDIEQPVHHWTFAPSDLDLVYGDRYPGWDKNIFIGGLFRKSLLRVELKNNVFIHDEILLENIGRIRDVKFGPDKFLYVMTEDSGVIVRLIPVKKIIKR